MYGTIDEFNFRQLHHQILLLMEDERNLAILKTMSFPHADTDNAVLLYGYIDKTAGLTFEMLAFVNVLRDGTLQCRKTSEDTIMKLRYDSIEGILVSVNEECIYQTYKEKIEGINRSYRADEVVEQFREIESIDSSRHPQFPDDIIVYFFPKTGKPEGIWCRICGIRNGNLCAEMLNTPYGNFGVSQGDIIEITSVEADNELKAVAVL